VVGQIATSLVLLVCAALMVRSLQSAQRVSPGFDPDGVALISLNLATAGYDAARGRQFYYHLLERAAALPGVEAVSYAQIVPLSGGGSRRGMQIEGYTPGPGESTETNFNLVGPGYFELMRIPLARGRGLDERDRDGSLPVAVVNQAFAERYWPGQNPIGRRIRAGGPGAPPLEVVGVAGNGKYRSLSEDPLPFVWAPLYQMYSPVMTLHVRTGGDPAQLLQPLRQVVRSLDPALPVSNPGVLRSRTATVLLPQRVGATLIGGFAGLTVLLAIVGLYGVLSYQAGQRTREIGIRMALGARGGDIRRDLLGRGLALAGLGMVAGLLPAFAGGRLIRSFLFGIGPGDPVALGAVTVLLLAAAGAASYLPARRAARLDPAAVLRGE
jgi:predicted permease